MSKKLLLAEEISILCVFLRSVGRCFLVKLVGHYCSLSCGKQCTPRFLVLVW